MTVSANSTPVTIAKEEAIGENLGSNLVRVPYIHYPINFGKKSVSALVNSGSEFNAVYPAFAKKLGLLIRPTNVGAQKIDGAAWETYWMVVAAFSVEDKANRERFFEETFLMANVSPEVVFEILFLILSGADVDFLGWELRWKTYTIKEALPTTRHVVLVDKKGFVAAALDLKHEIYIVHVGSVSSDVSSSSFLLDVHPSRGPQISGLIAEEAPTKVLAKYLDFADVFSPDLASELTKYTKINDHTIKVVDGQQLPYGPIYILGPVKLETLKAYIKTNLANGFIRYSKSFASAPILFDRKSDDSLRLCVDYWGLNNLTIKNRYLLPLIGELLDRLGRARRFTRLELTSIYHRMRICKGDEWKTAFKTQYCHFEYQVMLFALTMPQQASKNTSTRSFCRSLTSLSLYIWMTFWLILIMTEIDTFQPYGGCWNNSGSSRY